MIMSEINYSIALRCIGEDLQRQGIKAFDIMRDGDLYIVLCGHQQPPATMPATIRYTSAEIAVLDRHGEERRGKKTNNEFLNQAQMLRAIGDHLDKYDSNLIRVTNNSVDLEEYLFRVEYITREGEHVVDDRPGSAIFDMCILMYQKRSRISRAYGRSTR
jgi:hypothetical protein